MLALEVVHFQDLRTEVPELARYQLLSTTMRLPVCRVGIIEFPPDPAPRASEHARGMRPQPITRQQVA
jgi:hypothetical protein